MAASGHENAFPRPRLSARYRFSQRTFAGTRGNGRDAPIPDLSALIPERGGSTLNRPWCPCRRIVGFTGERSFAQCDSAIHANWSSSAFASFKSGLSKPSVNQP